MKVRQLADGFTRTLEPIIAFLKLSKSSPPHLTRHEQESRKQMKPSISASQQLIGEIESLEREANRIGALVTARALNQAKNALGWEAAGDILAAGKAARGARPVAAKST